MEVDTERAVYLMSLVYVLGSLDAVKPGAPENPSLAIERAPLLVNSRRIKNLVSAKFRETIAGRTRIQPLPSQSTPSGL